MSEDKAKGTMFSMRDHYKVRPPVSQYKSDHGVNPSFQEHLRRRFLGEQKKKQKMKELFNHLHIPFPHQLKILKIFYICFSTIYAPDSEFEGK